MPSDANSYQVGGDHYRNEYQHWDFAEDVNMGYLAGYGSKYLTRCGKKEGAARQDLEKALHCALKMEDRITTLLPRIKHTRPPQGWVIEQANRFCTLNGLNDEAREAVTLMACWQGTTDLKRMQLLIKVLLHKFDNAQPKPVPLEDSNKHADRTET